MAKNKDPQNAWEYADWLLNSGRLTIEEHQNLQEFLFQLENECWEDIDKFV